MECPREKGRCSGCGSRDVSRRGSRQRQVVAPPLALQKPERNEAQRLQEDLVQIWTGSKASAAILPDDWCRRARATGIRVLQTMANTLQGHRTGILGWYDDPISSSSMEGVNNKIGALQGAAYGYRDQQHFILKLFALHEAKFKVLF
ncbi:MAG: transposase [Bacteroidota bacterium]